MGDDPGNTQPDRWGLKGKEDLGDGLSAIFQLENGFYTNNGQFATANTIWNRAAFVGLGSERYGTLTLGRQTPLSFDYLDPLSTAYLAMSWYAFHPGNIDGLAATGNVPYNNSVKSTAHRPSRASRPRRRWRSATRRTSRPASRSASR